jgi:hypothetical protein
VLLLVVGVADVASMVAWWWHGGGMAWWWHGGGMVVAWWWHGGSMVAGGGMAILMDLVLSVLPRSPLSCPSSALPASLSKDPRRTKSAGPR